MMAKRLRPVVALAALTLGLAAVSPQASAKEAPTQEELKALWKAEDYKGLTKALNALAKEDPENGGIQLQLGLAYLKAEKYTKAVEAFAQAEAKGIPAHLTQYNSACAHALDGNADAAFTALSAALDAGFSDMKLMQTDTDLANIRGDARFAAAAARADQNSRPCEVDARFSGLDFWVGEWEVTNAKGHKVGLNTISKDLRGCAIHESWTGLYGPNGKSVSVYDAASDTWRQTWISAGGGVTFFDGGSTADGKVVFEGDAVALDGTVTQARMTLIANDDGTISQTGERSKDGNEWKVMWQGTYTPKASE